MKRAPKIMVGLAVAVALGGYAVYNRPPTPGRPGQGGQRPAPSYSNDAETQKIIEELCAKWDAVERVSAVIHTNMSSAAGMKGETKGKGDYAYQRTSGDPLIHFRLRNMLSIKHETTLPDGRTADTLFTGEVLVYLHDGSAFWQLVHQHELRHVYKRRYDPSEVLQLGGHALWETLADQATVSLLPGEKAEELGGKETYVFSVTPLNGDWSGTHWFDQQTGLRVRTVEKDAAGAEKLKLWLDEIDFEPAFPEDHFVFEVPEGFDLVDETEKREPDSEAAP